MSFLSLKQFQGDIYEPAALPPEPEAPKPPGKRDKKNAHAIPHQPVRREAGKSHLETGSVIRQALRGRE